MRTWRERVITAVLAMTAIAVVFALNLALQRRCEAKGMKARSFGKVIICVER